MDDVVGEVRKRISSKLALNREQAVSYLQQAIESTGAVLGTVSVLPSILHTAAS